jgi:hypothetical protein
LQANKKGNEKSQKTINALSDFFTLHTNSEKNLKRLARASDEVQGRSQLLRKCLKNSEKKQKI